MMDEETGAEPRVVSASIVDPYLMIIRDDSSVFIAKIGTSDELEEVDKPGGVLTSTKWQAGCLYADSQGTFQPMQTDGPQTDEKTMMFLLSTSGALHVRLVTCSLAALQRANCCRYMISKICPSPSMWQKGSHPRPHSCLQTSLVAEQPPKRC